MDKIEAIRDLASRGPAHIERRGPHAIHLGDGSQWSQEGERVVMTHPPRRLVWAFVGTGRELQDTVKA